MESIAIGPILRDSFIYYKRTKELKSTSKPVDFYPSYGCIPMPLTRTLTRRSSWVRIMKNINFRAEMITTNLDFMFIKTAAYKHFGRDNADLIWEVAKPYQV